MSEQSVGYAPEYAKSERLRIVAFWTALAVFAYALKVFFFDPWFAHILALPKNTPIFFGLPVSEAILYVLSAGLPFVLTLVTLFTHGYHGVLVLKLRQSPLPGEKVFRRRIIKRGSAARIAGISELCVPLVLLFLTIIAVVLTSHMIAALK